MNTTVLCCSPLGGGTEGGGVTTGGFSGPDPAPTLEPTIIRFCNQDNQLTPSGASHAD